MGAGHRDPDPEGQGLAHGGSHATGGIFADGLRVIEAGAPAQDMAVILRQFSSLLTPEDLHQRFGLAGYPAREARAVAACLCSPSDQVMIWALAADEALVGIVNLVPFAASGEEIGIIVRSDMKRRGVGWRLLEAAKGHARQRQISRLRGFVFWGNRAMLGLARKSGFESVASEGLFIEVAWTSRHAGTQERGETAPVFTSARQRSIGPGSSHRHL